MKYEYEPSLECYKRIDKTGRPLKFNIEEARRIKSMRDMGCTVSSIYRKIDWSNDVSETQLRTFVENIEKGNIPLDGEYPTPVKTQSTKNSRIDDLEKRVTSLEDRMSELRSDCFVSAFASQSKKKNTMFGKVKGWLQY